MRDEDEIRGALAEHEMNTASPEKLKRIAKSLGWTYERAWGYAEGVRFAYLFVLSEEVGA